MERAFPVRRRGRAWASGRIGAPPLAVRSVGGNQAGAPATHRHTRHRKQEATMAQVDGATVVVIGGGVTGAKLGLVGWPGVRLMSS